MPTLTIQNLKCTGCANTIHKKASQVSGISNIEVNVEESSIRFNANKQSDIKALKEVLAKNGYPSSDEINTTLQKAKSYVSCAIGKLNN